MLFFCVRRCKGWALHGRFIGLLAQSRARGLAPRRCGGRGERRGTLPCWSRLFVRVTKARPRRRPLGSATGPLSGPEARLLPGLPSREYGFARAVKLSPQGAVIRGRQNMNRRRFFFYYNCVFLLFFIIQIEFRVFFYYWGAILLLLLLLFLLNLAHCRGYCASR